MTTETLIDARAAANAGQKQGGRPFQKGQSGNPAGKKPGTRNHASRLVETMMAGDVEEITQKVISAAKNGDLTAARIVLDRISPPRKDNPITLDLPKLETASDAVEAMGLIMVSVAQGEISPSEAATLTDLVSSFTKTLELSEFEQRLNKLEEAASSCRQA